MRQQWQHLVARWPKRPMRLPTPSAPRPPPLLTPQSLPLLHYSSSTSRAAFLRHRPRSSSPALSILATSAHHQRLRLAPSSASLSRSPRLPQLPMVSLPSAGIARWSPGRAHRGTLLRGLLRSALHFPFSVHASHSPCFPSARAPLPMPSLARRWSAAVEPHHRSAITTSRALPELHRLDRLVHLTRLAVGSTVVLLFVPMSSGVF
jgi:hypothetical protein